MAFTLDVKGAHKRVRVLDEEQGLLLFRWMERLMYYVVCHFGAAFSDWHWSPSGSASTRATTRSASTRVICFAPRQSGSV